MGVTIYRRSGHETAADIGPLGAAVRRRFDRYPEAQSVVVGDGPPSSEGYRPVTPPARCDVHYLRRATDGRLRWAGAVKFSTAECPSLRQAMTLVTERIVPTGHGHIVHTGRGLQVVDRSRVFGCGDVRPLAHMAFDGGARRFVAILGVLESLWGDELQEYDLGGIPCLGLPLEGEPETMEQTLHGLLAAIDPAGFGTSVSIAATVYDEAPPGSGPTPFVPRNAGLAGRRILGPRGGASGRSRR